MNTLFTPYGLLSALALLATLLVAGLWCRVRKTPYSVWIRLCAAAVPLAWLGSRITFCLANIPYYLSRNFGLMLRFWEGGGSLFGAFGGLLLAAWLTARWQNVKASLLLDAVALGAPVGTIIERLAESTAEGMGWGDAIMSEWLMPVGLTSSKWHPVYLYEAFAAGIILLALLLWLRARKGQFLGGDLLLLFMTLYGCVQVVLESMRDDAHMIVHHFVHINQIIAIVLPVIAVVIWGLRALKNGTKKGQMIAIWLVSAAMIGVGIAQEFAVDHSENLFIDYGIMAAAMAVIAIGALYLRRKGE